MKTVILSLSLMFVLAFATFAQSSNPKGTPQERATKRSTALTQKLALSAEQAAKVSAAMLVKFTAFDKARSVQPADKNSIKTARTVYQTEMKSILNQEQYAKWEEMRKKAREKAKAKRDAKKSTKEAASTEEAQDEAEDEI